MNLKDNNNWPIKFRESFNDLDSSKLQTFIECPRLYFYEHLLGWKTKAPSNHLIFGSAVHEAMEHLYINGFGANEISTAYDKFITYYRQTFPESTDELFTPKTPDRFILMLIEYVQHYADDFRKYAVVYTEVTGKVNVTEDVTMIFKIDAILRDLTTGHYKTLEHKTLQGYFSAMWDAGWQLGIQAGTYTHALYSLYAPDEVDGVLINGLGFKKTKAPLFDFHRVPIYKTPYQMQIWLNTVTYWIERLQDDFAKLQQTTASDSAMKAFGLNPKSCTNWGRVCAYHDFCTCWPNPLQRCHTIPMGFKEEFWMPLEVEHSSTFMDFTVK